MKKSTRLVFVLLFGIAILFLIGLKIFIGNKEAVVGTLEVASPVIESPVIDNNKIILNSFEFIYDRQPSHTCPGPSERLNFTYGRSSVTIIARDRVWMGRTGGSEEDFPWCGHIGKLMNYYNYDLGLFEGLSNKCKVIKTFPALPSIPDYSYAFSAECKDQVQFKILASEKVNSCLTQENCELINGVDVLLLN